jgi:hypothetical protein
MDEQVDVEPFNSPNVIHHPQPKVQRRPKPGSWPKAPFVSPERPNVQRKPKPGSWQPFGSPKLDNNIFLSKPEGQNNTVERQEFESDVDGEEDITIFPARDVRPENDTYSDLELEPPKLPIKSNKSGQKGKTPKKKSSPKSPEKDQVNLKDFETVKKIINAVENKNNFSKREAERNKGQQSLIDEHILKITRELRTNKTGGATVLLLNRIWNDVCWEDVSKTEDDDFKQLRKVEKIRAICTVLIRSWVKNL